MKQYPDMKRLMVECQCGCKIYDMSYWTDDPDPEIMMAVYAHSKPSWWWRFKMIKSLLFGSNFYAEDIVINRDEAVELRNFLDGYIVHANKYVL